MKRCKLRRRDFITGGGAAILGLGASGVFAEMTRHPLAGAVLPKWEAGHLRIGIIYTGRSESQLLVFPDGTSLLIDCGDFVQGGDTAVPHLPKNAWRAGEATARYVLRENPNGKKLDYFLLTHYHNDHFGSPSFSAGRSARYSLSGFGQALGFLDVDTIIDRAWPDMNNPAPRADTYDASVILHIKECYAEAVRRGSKIEKYRLEKGSSQICMRHGGNAPHPSRRRQERRGEIHRDDRPCQDAYDGLRPALRQRVALTGIDELRFSAGSFTALPALKIPVPYPHSPFSSRT